MNQELPVIAIVGRPNVGKSALFNRIVGRRVSIVHEQAGVTRDRIMAPVVKEGREFLLVDTGGLGVIPREQKKVDMWDSLIRQQVEAVMEDAQFLIWVVDVQHGATQLETEIAEYLRQSQIPVVIAANKADNYDLERQAEGDFAHLGVPVIIPTSCLHNIGIGELIEQGLANIPIVNSENRPDGEPERTFNLAIVGRPNVGKSSLVNCLLGDERVVVSEVAGTTRDAVDVPFLLKEGGEELPVTLIDTAGLRKKSRIGDVVEYFSVMRSQNAIRRADLVIQVVDASEPGTSQDRHIARLIAEEHKACVVVVNKWDLAKGGTTKNKLREKLHSYMPFITHTPLVTISAKEKHNIQAIPEAIMLVKRGMDVKVPTSVLNRFLQDTIMRTPPPAIGGKFFKLFYATMLESHPPCFSLFVNNPKLCPSHYKTYLENQIRQAFYAEAGLPIRLILKARRRDEETDQGNRRAIGGIMKRKLDEKRDVSRRTHRQKGYRKK